MVTILQYFDRQIELLGRGSFRYRGQIITLLVFYLGLTTYKMFYKLVIKIFHSFNSFCSFQIFSVVSDLLGFLCTTHLPQTLSLTLGPSLFRV